LHFYRPFHQEELFLTPMYPTDRESLERDSDLEFIKASGPGGQHRNKVETGVRLVHRPTGITVTATERRSQHANREAAFERMQTRLEEFQHVEMPRKPTRPTAASRARRINEKRVSGLRKKLRSTPAEE
jgi:protein subunit release factor B